jgi:hypothetical protein
MEPQSLCFDHDSQHQWWFSNTNEKFHPLAIPFIRLVLKSLYGLPKSKWTIETTVNSSRLCKTNIVDIRMNISDMVKCLLQLY